MSGRDNKRDELDGPPLPACEDNEWEFAEPAKDVEHITEVDQEKKVNVFFAAKLRTESEKQKLIKERSKSKSKSTSKSTSGMEQASKAKKKSERATMINVPKDVKKEEILKKNDVQVPEVVQSTKSRFPGNDEKIEIKK
ncbi:unnamed protein product [Bursaphelenchus okinawaensis]|uniref:Uncharacterized protein n=1 Tax=Bursaphelenchus okinawaensis TaxID=465554 RepID=A0A811JRE0_9BILA|nr:unnamed protein product [Bursaphelenchus okinawaensis]CAG9080054.1 unnamed protein product [Bursaphelenchus okinawaensis]